MEAERRSDGGAHHGHISRFIPNFVPETCGARLTLSIHPATTSKIVGPAAVVSSVTFSLQAVSTTYVCPLTPGGTTTLYPPGTGVAGTKIGPVMLMKAPKSAPPDLPLGSVST